ncbi:sensor histidine kinase [Pedobacter sp. N23S346]|uniref:sensor histidine kinase n=1 Tax=Pedobacter sp. N23S346 TaxID=3402750 RepID=UPI003AD47C71
MPLIERIVKFSLTHRFQTHVIFWLIVALLFMNRYDIEEYKQFDSIIYRQIYYISVTMLASYFLAYLIIPKLMRSKNYFEVVVYFIAGSYLISACSRIAVIYLLEPLIRTPPFAQESLWQILSDLPKLVTHYFALSFSAAWVFAFVKLIRDQYVVQQRSLMLEKEKAETELKALRSQLNPHFLFNTLNNIYSLSLMNSPVTSRSIAGLSEILDHVLYRCNTAYVSISSEIKLIENYLALEKLRYDERLQVNFDYIIDREASIAPLILLSFVENAFKHGAGMDAGYPFIAINLHLQNGHLSFKVTNSILDDEPETGDNRIGLNNVTRQLDLVYPLRYNLNIKRINHIYEVELGIDLEEV